MYSDLPVVVLPSPGHSPTRLALQVRPNFYLALQEDGELVAHTEYATLVRPTASVGLRGLLFSAISAKVFPRYRGDTWAATDMPKMSFLSPLLEDDEDFLVQFLEAGMGGVVPINCLAFVARRLRSREAINRICLDKRSTYFRLECIDYVVDDAPMKLIANGVHSRYWLYNLCMHEDAAKVYAHAIRWGRGYLIEDDPGIRQLANRYPETTGRVILQEAHRRCLLP